LEAGAAEPLYRQIYRRIESAIFAGELPEGSPLPSSRGLAEHLRVSRVTVVNAYDWLIADGLAVTRPGSGIRVARASGLEAEKVARGRHDDNAILPLRGCDDAPNRHPCRHPLAFQPDMPALDHFPRPDLVAPAEAVCHQRGLLYGR
jgi:GntR family transcriptional regulator/MocR family aminotransferase